MQHAKSVSSPLAHHFKLSKEQAPKTETERAEMDTIPYASAVGSLMYAMVCSRPDIGYAMSMVSRYLSDPGHKNIGQHSNGY